MAILIELLLGVIGVTTIIIWVVEYNKNKEVEDTDGLKIGLYEADIEINNKIYKIKTEVQLVRDYGDNDVHVVHNKIFGLPKENEDIGMEKLLTEHTLISKEDVKWEI